MTKPADINLPALAQRINSSRVPTGPKLADLAGMAEARAWAESIIRDIALYRCGKLPWSEIDPGCVLHGPPGTGKSTFARSFAATAEIAYIPTSFADWQSSDEGHLGSTIAAMRSAFADAAAHRPCVLAIDELDSIPKRAGTGRHAEYWNQFTNSVLTEFDTLARIGGVIVIGTCNHPELLDPALVRAGRMDRMIAVAMPSLEELEGIVSFHLTEDERCLMGGYAHYTLADAALVCVGMTGADVAQTIRVARRIARHKNQMMELSHYIEAIEQGRPRLDPQSQIRIAIHEAGHAVASIRLALSTQVTASILARNSALGGVQLKNVDILTPQLLSDYLAAILAGRASEEIMLGSASSLAGGNAPQSDIALANRLAADAVLRLGFCDGAGLSWHSSDAQDFTLTPGSVASQQVREMIDTAYHRAGVIIRTESNFVRAVAQALLDRRVLRHDDIVTLDPETRPRLAQPQQTRLPNPTRRRDDK